MEFVTGLEDRKVKTLEELEREESVGTEVTVEGMVHSIRDMGEISFVILRSRDGLLQTRDPGRIRKGSPLRDP